MNLFIYSAENVLYVDKDMGTFIARKGIFVTGEYSGWEIVVADDRDDNTGGYYLYLKKSDVLVNGFLRVIDVGRIIATNTPKDRGVPTAVIKVFTHT